MATVLVVDDDATARDLMRRFLAKEGFDVVTAADGAEGLRIARDVRPAIITLDVMMPNLDGWEVLQRLKADRELASIPVVMLTIVDEQSRGYTLGAADYMTKPIDRDRLGAILRKHASTGGRHALVVEDEETTRRILASFLASEGWHVTEAANGREALERAAARAPDLILLDLMMPEIDGFEFLAARAVLPELENVPVVVVTAADLDQRQHALLNGGVQAVVSKAGLGRDEFLRQLRDILRAELTKGRAS